MRRGHPTGPGLQVERTQLAWRRTALALVVGALLALRLLAPVAGFLSFVVGLAGTALSGAIWVLAARRGRRARRALLTSSHVLPGGGLLLLVTATVSGCAAVGLLYVVLRHLP